MIQIKRLFYTTNIFLFGITICAILIITFGAEANESYSAYAVSPAPHITSALISSETAAMSPTLTTQLDNCGVSISWDHVNTMTQYELWKSPNPFFAISDSDAQLLTSFSGAQLTTSYTVKDDFIILDGYVPDFYLLKSSDGVSDYYSERTGEFSFPLKIDDSQTNAGASSTSPPQLSVSQTNNDPFVLPNGNLIYTIYYANGGGIATGVLITETIPAYGEFVQNDNVSGWTAVGNGQQIQYDLGTVQPCETGSLTVSVKVSDTIPAGATVFSSTVSMSADQINQNSIPADTVGTLLSQGPTNICGDIMADTVWSPQYSPYVISCNTTIDSGAMVTVESGAVVKLDSGVQLDIQGNMSANGISDRFVYFTSLKDDSIGGDTNGDGDSTVPAAGDWNRIIINSNHTVFNYVDIRYGGEDYGGDRSAANIHVRGDNFRFTNSNNAFSQKHGVYLENYGFYGQTTIQDNYFSHNLGYPVYFDAEDAPDFYLPSSQNLFGNDGQDNQYNGIYLSGAVSDTLTLDKSGDLIYVIGDMTVPQNMSLVIEPNTVVKMSQGGNLDVSGILTADGSTTEKIYITSIHDDTVGGDSANDGNANSPAKGDWSGLSIRESGNATLNHVIIRYGGDREDYFEPHEVTSIGVSGVLNMQNSEVSFSGGSGLVLQLNQERTIIQDNHFSNNDDYAIRFDNDESYIEELVFPTGNQLLGNTGSDNQYNGILMDGRITGTLTLSSAHNFPFIPYNLVIPAGATLDIRPDTILKMASNGKIDVHGTLSATGTALNRIYFTSLHDDSIGGDTDSDNGINAPTPGDWVNIKGHEGSEILLEFTALKYGGWNYDTFPSLGTLVRDTPNNPNDGRLVMKNSEISFSLYAGVYLSCAGNVILQDNYFESNNHYAVMYHNNSICMEEVYLPTGDSLTGNDGVNNQVNGILLSGLISGTTMLSTTNQFPYILNHVRVLNGSSLEVAAGVNIKAIENATLTVDGVLSSTGTVTHPIIFTSIKDDAVGGDTNNDGNLTTPAPGDWFNIQVSEYGRATLEYTFLKYGGYDQSLGYSDPLTFATLVNNNELSLRNSSIFSSAQSALIHSGSSATLLQNRFIGNQGYAVAYVPNQMQPYSNTLSAQYNYWGEDTGPVIGQIANSVTFNQVYDYDCNCYVYTPTVEFVPWLDAQGSVVGGPPLLSEAPTEFCGTISADTTWTAGESPYLITCDSSISQGATLTVGIGTVIKFANETRMTVAGTLLAKGTDVAPIYFTSIQDDSIGGDNNNDNDSTSPTSGDWQGIKIINTGTAVFDYSHMLYGGYSDSYLLDPLYSTILVENGIIEITNSEISYSEYTGLYLRGDQQHSIIQDNVFNYNESAVYIDSYNNDSGEIENLPTGYIHGNSGISNTRNTIGFSGSFTSTTYLGKMNDLAYDGSFTIAEGATLILEPGVVFKGGRIDVYGTLSATGSIVNPIVFTSFKDDSILGDSNNDGNLSSPAPGDWEGIKIWGAGQAFFDYTNFYYGGYFDSYLLNPLYSTILVENGTIEITNSEISYSEYTGLYLQGDQQHSVIQDNVFNYNESAVYIDSYNNDSGEIENLPTGHIHGNSGISNTRNTIGFSGSFTSTTYLGKMNDLAYDGSFTIAEGATLILEPGVVFKGGRIDVYGTLSATGSIVNPIIFTSFKDDSILGDSNNDGNLSSPAPGDWEGIKIWSTGQAFFDYTNFYYGGYFDSYLLNPLYSTILVENGTIEIMNSEISYSEYTGLYLQGDQQHSIIQDNVFSFNESAMYIDSYDYNSSEIKNLPTGNHIRGNTGVSNTRNIIGFSGSFTGTTYLDKMTSLAYDGYFTIAEGATLILEPGVVFKGGRIDVHGTLSATGSISNPILFTSFKDDSVLGDSNNDGSLSSPTPGDWEGIKIWSTGQAIFDYTYIYYGGYTYYDPNSFNQDLLYATILNQNTLSMTNSIVSYSQHHGVFHTGQSIYLANNRFQGNQGFAVYNDEASSQTTILAEYNYWGDPGGPTSHYLAESAPNGVNIHSEWDHGCGCMINQIPAVDFDPWLDSNGSVISNP